MNIGTLTVVLTANTLGLRKAVADVKAFEKAVITSSKGIVASLGKVSAATKMTGQALTKNLSLPIALIGGVGLNAFTKFEYSLSKITGLVGIADDTTQRWGKSLLAMSTNVGKAPNELAEALYFVTSNGIRTEEALRVVEMAAKGSATGMGTTADIAKLATAAMKAYGEANLSAAQSVDVIAMTIREGAVAGEQLVQTMGVVLPIASQMGVTFDQVGAAIAAMTRTGTNASTAATQLRQLLFKLKKPANQSEEAIDDLGSSFEQLQQTIKQKGLLQALTDIDEMTKIYGDSMVAELIPNIRALNAMLDITGKNFGENKVIFQNTADAAESLNHAFANVEYTMNQKLNIASAAMQRTFIEIGRAMKESFIPLMARLVSWLNKLTKWLDGLTMAQKDSYTTILLWVAAAGPFLLVLGGIISMVGKLVLVFKALAAAALWLTKGMATLNAVMALNPWVALAAVAGIIAWTFYRMASATDSNTKSQKSLNEQIASGTKLLNERRTSTEKTLRSLKLVKTIGTMGTGFKSVANYGVIAESLAKNAIGGMSASEISNARQVLTDELVTLEKKINNFKETVNNGWELDQLKETYVSYGFVLRMLTKEQEVMADSLLGLEAAGKRNGIENGLKKNIEAIKELAKWTGIAVEDTDLLSAYTSTLQSLIEVGGADPARLAELGGFIGSLTAKIEAEKDALKAVTKAREANNESLEGFAIMAKKAMFAQQELLGFQRQGVDNIDNVFGKGEGNNSKSIFDSKANVFTSLEGRLALYNNTVDGTVQKNKLLTTSMYDLFNGMQDALTQAFEAGGSILEQFGKFFGDFIKGLIFKLVAASIAALVLVSLIRMIPGLGTAGGLLQGGGPGKNMLSMMGQFMGKGGIPGLAEGGIVPRGYPSDTYSANLSSQEAVIPLNRLPQLMNVDGGSRQKKVVFEIDGRVIKGIMEDANMMEGIG